MANVNIISVEDRGTHKKVVADIEGKVHVLRVLSDAECERECLRIAALPPATIALGPRTVNPPTPPSPDAAAIARTAFENTCKALAMARVELDNGLGDPIGVFVPADLVSLKATIDSTYRPEYAPILAKWGI